MDTIVLYPSPGRGHLVSMVELGKLILKHHPSFYVTVIITTTAGDTGYATTPYINSVTATTPSITFHHLPTLSSPLAHASAANLPNLSFEIPRLNNPNLHQALLAISQSSNLKAFVIDFFCNAAFEVSTKLKIPTYYFFTSGAHGLAIFLYFPTTHRNITKSLKDLDRKFEIHIPGSPPIPVSDMPMAMFDRSSTTYQNFIETANTMPKSAGIMINTFEMLESKSIKAILEGHYVTDGPTPPIFCIGPIIATNDQGGEGKHECLSWLDSQPSRSVVFLSFGSMGLLPEDQLKEMATGLERSGVRFLWVVRNPPTEGETRGRILANVETSLDSFLPQGFLERTKDRGFVVRSWAPQVDVLSHDSVGGFVTHCGWNSVLESVCSGVPMVAWPLYAEQKLNRMFLVEEMKVALRLNESENGSVSAAELEERVRELMDSGKGKEVRDRVSAFRDGAIAATSEGGSSRVALAKLVESMKGE